MIIYTSVSRNEVVLAEYSTAAMNDAGVNLVTVTQMVLSNISSEVEEGSRRSFVFRGVSGKVEPLGGDQQNKGGPAWVTLEQTEDVGIVGSSDFYIHVLRELHGVIYLCLSENNTRVDRYYKVLDDIEKAFSKKFSNRQIRKANAYEMEKKFSKKLGEYVHHFNTHPDTVGVNQSEVKKAMDKVESIKSVANSNIRRSIENSEEIEKLDKKSSLLRRESQVFSRKSTKLKKKVRAQNYKYNWCIVIAISLGIYVVIAWKCGLYGEICADNLAKRTGKNSNDNDNDNNGNGNNNNDNGNNNNNNGYENDYYYPEDGDYEDEPNDDYAD